ncbi:MAG: efflux RND transporter permease subunit [Alphaproteobacteria bacterium]
MAFTDRFILRPVLASVVSLLILLVGGVAGFSLQVRQYPELTNTTISITTAYPGANADLIKGFITTPIEQAVASAEGIDTLVSTSRQNVSTVTLNLRLGADPDRAVADVLSKVNQVAGVLPREANDPVVTKQTGDGFALMYLSFNSEQMGASQITDYISRVVQPTLQTIDGVANAQILGGQVFAMRVWLDPGRMAAFDVTPGEVGAALAANNFTTAAGQLKNAYTQTGIDAVTALDDADAFGQLVVASRGDTLIRISDVATVDLGPQNVDSSTVFDGLKAVFIGIYATPSANPLTVINDVRAAFPGIQAQLPPTIAGAIAYDATEFIRASIDEVAVTLGEAALIVIVVIFLFLGDLRSTLIPVVTIPLSLVGVLIVLLALGYSINLITLLALVLAIGLVVDDAIVVVENIYRHVEDGMPPMQAALRGAREIVMPVISMTITLAAVYAPIGFVGGLTGALFREFAFTLAGSVFVSGVIALTLSPMMCARLLKHRPGGRGGARGFAGALDRMFAALRRRYQRRLHRTLNFRALTLLVLVGITVFTGLLYLTTPQELAPEEDQGVLLTLVKTPQYANLDYLEASTDLLQRVSGQIPEREHFFGINGLGDVHSGFAGLILQPWAERDRSAKEILQSLQAPLATVPAAQILAFSPPPLPGSTGGTPVQFVVTTIGDQRQLAETVEALQLAALQSGLFIFTDTDLKFDTPQVRLTVNQDKANLLGVTMQDIGSTLSTLLGGNYVNRFNLYGRSYQVIPQVPRDARQTADWLGRFRVRAGDGTQIPLSTVVDIAGAVQPNALTTFQQLNAATLSGVPFPGRTLGEALEFLETTAQTTLPDGFTYDFQGQSRQYVQEGNTLALTFVFALVVIFLVLAAQFESFRDPLTILIALPTSMFGALLPLNVMGLMGQASINIYSQIGLVTLVGLISKHGILMVEFANKLQEQGMSRREAIETAAGVRLRPILMTTAAMVVAMVPLLTATGAGAASRFNIGVVIAAGMTIGTLFTLFVTPAVYTLIARDHSRRPGAESVARPAAEPS